AGLTYYLRAMPGMLSWPIVALGVAYLAGVWFLPRLRLPRADAVFLSLWVGLGYVFYTMIALKEPRHILFITYPIVLTAVLLLDRLLEVRLWRDVLTLGVAGSVLAISAVTSPAPHVTGMRQAAVDVARIAPPETNVAFWGRLDGTFIFAMRAYAHRPDLGVIRLDKLLLGDVAISLDRGFTQRDLSPKQIAQQLHDLHVQYVVAQTHYEDQLRVINALNAALHSGKFRKVETIPMSANYPYTYITELAIYRAVAPVPRGRIAPRLDVKVINKSF
ncbi:MAG TPA: hypothetical protein VMF67_11710, partial [Rhizomicrobium sp.]|nr:hypothetical protein [Rhizomicrobium sp.]